MTCQILEVGDLVHYNQRPVYDGDYPEDFGIVLRLYKEGYVVVHWFREGATSIEKKVRQTNDGPMKKIA
jgi:hypothetical protein